MKKGLLFFLIVNLIAGALNASFVRQPVSEKIHPAIAQSKSVSTKAWILFTDKGIISRGEMDSYISSHKGMLTDKSIERRMKKGLPLYTFEDIPVYDEYIDRLSSMGIKPVHVSKWLNGVSAYVSSSDLDKLRTSKFVYYVYPVAKSAGIQYTSYDTPQIRTAGVYADTVNLYDYGIACTTQIYQLNVQKVHNLRFTGKGVTIAIFDTGFKVSEEYVNNEKVISVMHEALENVNIVNTYSFVNDTDYVGMLTGSEDDLLQVDHGTKMLALMGAYKARQMISPAFSADYILCETEVVESEEPSEEDNWIRAAEWVDSLGTDIISSSLGYKDWYPYDFMNGDSCLISAAADIAASHGILVVNVIGNVEYTDARADTSMVAPGDADSIITVGGNDDYRMWNDVSATGPVYDLYELRMMYPDPDTISDLTLRDSIIAYIDDYTLRRTKPDILALADPYTIHVSDSVSYTFVTGTSASTALIAGSCALLLQAHPDWTPQKVKDVLHETASMPFRQVVPDSLPYDSVPNDTIGWGIADFYAALMVEPVETVDDNTMLAPFPNPYSIANGMIKIPFRLIRRVSNLSFYVFTIDGRQVYSYEMTDLEPGDYMDASQAFTWNGINASNKPVAPGVYIVVMDTHFNKDIKKITIIP